MIKMWQEKTKLIKLKKMLQKFQKKIFSVEVSEKIFFVQSFYCYDITKHLASIAVKTMY